MKLFPHRTILLGGLIASFASVSTSAAAPAQAQGAITMRTYSSDARGGQATGATPDGVFYPKRMEGPYNGFPGDDPGDDTPPLASNRDSFTVELEGYFYPLKTGSIQFAIASDDQGALFLSTDDNPANAVEIAREPSWNPVRAFASETRRQLIDAGAPPVPRLDNQSAYISVTAGRPYYIRAWAVDFGGGDSLAVAMRYQGDFDFQDGGLPIDGQYLSTIDRADLAAPYISSFAGSPTGFVAELRDGAGASPASVDGSTVTVQFDGADVKIDVAKNGPVTMVTYSNPEGVLVPRSAHIARIMFRDTRGNNVVIDREFNIGDFGFLSKDLLIAPDTSKPGFLWRVSQVETGQPNSSDRAEQQLAGLLVDFVSIPLENVADNFVQGAAIDFAEPPPLEAKWQPIEFEISDVINLSTVGGDSNGAFIPDEQMPGIPGWTGSRDNVATEIITFIELPKGSTWMGVNSDDGFKTSGGNAKDLFEGIVFGEFDGTRGAADTIFPVMAEEAGVYGFRTIWYQGTQGANIEWFTLTADGEKVLVNDTANGGLKAYRESQGGLQSYVVSVSPKHEATQVALKPDIEIAFNDVGGKIEQSSIVLKLNGQELPAIRVSKSGDVITARATSAVDFNDATLVSAEVLYINDGKLKVGQWSFTTGIDLSTPGALFIEAEDFNFGGGNWVKDQPIGMNGKYAGGAYFELGTSTDSRIDWFDSARGNADQLYRPRTRVAAGKRNQHPDGLSRGNFDVEVNHVVGWNDLGDWQNYTRVFPEPARNYNVWGRLASGGAPINFELSRVTSPANVRNQTTEAIGEFRPGRATGGWDTFELFPLIDDDGNRVAVSLGGETTLRLTVLPGEMDIDFMAFLPAVGDGGSAISSVSIQDGNLRIEWRGTLQSADEVTGPWSPVPNVSSPASMPIIGDSKFYRVRN
ncbi:MAG: hypothetical protein O2960_26490 [Verrucomicrobia bacterium]|nr:hypothetical protein [Verrucomicrobiota bacterium]